MSEWFPFLKKGSSDNITDCLICFYHAGGSASSFSGLRKFGTEHFAALAAELPGHGRRIKEPPEADIRSLAKKLRKLFLTNSVIAGYGFTVTVSVR